METLYFLISVYITKLLKCKDVALKTKGTEENPEINPFTKSPRIQNEDSIVFSTNDARNIGYTCAKIVTLGTYTLCKNQLQMD